jgi:hypothetical protein
MSEEQFRKFVHQEIDQLAYYLKYPQVQNYDKVYKDAAVVMITSKAKKVRYGRS